MQDSSKILSGVLLRIKDQKLFKDIPDEDIKAALNRIEEIHILKDELAFRKGERYHKGIYFILSGKVLLSRPNSNVSYVAENEPVGLSSFLGKTMYTVNAVALTDCDLLYIHEYCIYSLMELSETFRNRLFQEIQTRLTSLDNTSNTFLLRSGFKTVGGCMSSPIITLQTGKSVADAARLMAEYKVGSLLVVNRKQIVKGLLTSRHLMLKFMQGLEDNIKCPEIEKYMDIDPITFPPEYPIIEALNALKRVDASHGVVMSKNKPVGIISANDIALLLYENSSVYCAHIEGMETLGELKNVFSNIYKVARALAISSRVSRELLGAISSIHRAVQRKVFQITSNNFQEKHNFILSNHTYCYLILGAGARGEMDLLPQINTAIILEDSTDDVTLKMFEKFAKEYIENLSDIGYKPFVCEKRYYPTALLMRAKDWINEIDLWYSKDESMKFHCFSCIIDMQAFDGDITLAWSIRNYMLKKVADRPSILVKLLGVYPEVKVPVSQFGGFIVDKDGPREGMFDMKYQGLHYLVNTTRLLSIYAGISDMGTVARIEHLARKKIITEEMAKQTLMAFDTLVETIITEQINQAMNAQPITNYLNPTSLSLFYQEKLKRALHFLTIYTSNGIKFIKSL